MSMDIKSLLTNNMNPQAKLMAETRGLQGKWEKTGLLEGCKGVKITRHQCQSGSL